MSCLPGTPCYTTPTTSGCSSDPCYPTTTNSNLVCYAGPNLSCTGINDGDSLTVSLQKIDNTVCEVNETITASNGLYKNVSDIRLGGALTEDTTIVASTNTLSITGLYIDTNPHYLLTESVLGVVRVSTPQTILNNLTADNGITKTINNFQLGGALVTPTTITADVTNTLSIAGLVSNPSATYVVSVDNSTGLLTKTTVSAIVPTITSDNGLTKTGNNIQLGGALITPTTVTTDSTNTLSITGLSVDATPDFIVTETTAGVVKKISSTTLASNVLSLITADNGLNRASNTIKLGGILTANTFVELDQKTLNIKDTVYTSATGITILPGNDPQTSDLNWNLNTNTFTGKNIFNSFSYFANNVGIGTFPEPNNSAIATSNTRLSVYRQTGFTSNPIATTLGSTLDMSGVLGSGNTSIYASNFGNLRWAPTSNQTVLPSQTYAGNSSYLALVNAYNTTGGLLSSSAAQVFTAAASSVNVSGVSSSGVTITLPVGTDMTNILAGYQVIIRGGTGNFGYVNVYIDAVVGLTFTIKRISGGTHNSYTYTSVTPSVALSGATISVIKAASGNDLGSIDKAIGCRILAPISDRYGGSSFRIDSAIGLQIDDQASFPNPNTAWDYNTDLTVGYIGESYGIKQLGENDVNLYNAIINKLPNLPVYASNALALAGGLTVGTIYRTATGELRIVI